MPVETGRVIIATASQTYALKGSRLLSEKGIRSRVIRLRPSKARDGCTYGISLATDKREDAVRILLSGGVQYTEIIDE